MKLLLPDQAYKILITSPSQCEAVQLRLFELGYQWQSGGAQVRYRNYAKELHLNYARRPFSKDITFSAHGGGDWSRHFIPLTLLDLTDGPETPEPMKEVIPEGPYSQWDRSCLAKMILRRWPGSNLFFEACEVMSDRTDACYTTATLCRYMLESDGLPAELPPDILAELKRRAGM